MPTPLRRRLRLARRGAWYVAASLLVLMALGAGVASQLLPLAERHPERIAAWLSQRAGRPVAFDRVSTEWTRRGPLLRVDGLRVGRGADAVPIGEAEILVSQYAGLLPGRSFTELRLEGLDLTLVRDAEGRWSVRGLPGEAESRGDPLDALEALGELQVVRGRLAILAPELGIDARLSRVDLRLRVQGDRLRAAARGWVANDTEPLVAKLDFNRARGGGRAYIAASDIDLAAWGPLLSAAGVRADAGAGRAQLWAELHAHRISKVTLDAAFSDLRLAESVAAGSGAGQRTIRSLAFPDVEVRARWQSIPGGWRMDVPRLRLRQGTDGAVSAPQVLDGLLLAGGARPALLAERIDVGPLLDIASLSDRVPAGVRDWLATARPSASLSGVEVVVAEDGSIEARARVDALRLASGGDGPGLAGLAGTLRGDRDGVVFDIDATKPVDLDWSRAFGRGHRIALRGRLVAWREAATWRVGTPGLRITTDGVDLGVRGALTPATTGNAARIDLVAALDDVELAVARRFLVRHRMPAATVRWLDEALLEGRIRHGRVIIAGESARFPFEDGGGIFRADGHLDGAVVRFSSEWPAAAELQGPLVFENDGFRVAGSATLGGVAIQRIEAGIAHFGSTGLEVRATAADDAARFLALLRQSPLRASQGETLAALRASGPAEATFSLALPLHAAAATPRLGGTVQLKGLRLADSRWDLAFADVRGALRYDGDGFTADGLKVSRDGQPGVLGLRAGPSHVRDRRQAFEAELTANIGTGELLQRAPEMAWLKPYVAGRSAWTIGVTVPAARPAGAPAGGAGARLQLRSTLVGTRLRLPAPLDKATTTPLATVVETRLPLDDGEVSVVLGDRLALRARSVGGRTGVRVVLGGGRVEEAPPPQGLVATGRASELDAIGWATLASGSAGGSASPGSGLTLRSVDLEATRLLALGGAFPATRVRAVPAPGGTAIQFEGAALSGSLMAPTADGGPLAGRLQRMHWRADVRVRGEDDAQGGTRAAPAPPGDDTDPARVPPLNLAVDDLRFGDATLGNASLQTRRTATGLQIERLQARAPGQRIDITGEWTGRGASARTHLRVGLQSEDFGALLAGFGMGGRIDGGHGDASFDAAWPGNPAQFKLEALQGGMVVAVKDGRLVEVEPGAGRVLGLLSITELPRRLTLDFRDFFSKGFAFNRIGGKVRFADGLARTDDLEIDGPAAEIHVRGAANLRAQTYDQTIEVLPKTGNLLAAVGAITAGPIGAAVGAVANAVLQKPLAEMNARTYRVTGPWKDPQVEVRARGAAQATRRAAATEQEPDATPVPPG